MKGKGQISWECEPDRRCGLAVHGPVEARDVEAAWRLLPDQGHGWVCLADRVLFYDPTRRSGLLLDAEVADGRRTYVLRHDRGVWRRWVWEELLDRDDHLVFEDTYLSTAAGAAPGKMRVATYWGLQNDDLGVPVWMPCGSRFMGWEDEP